MVEQSAAFHHTKYIKSHDNMAQIILPSKINSVDTSDEIQNHQKDIAQTKVAHCMGTSDEIQNHQKDTAQTKIAHCMATSNEIHYHLTDSMPKEVRNCMDISN